MKETTSRRLFMRNSAFAISGLALLSPTFTQALSNSESPYLGYNPYAENKKDLRQGLLSLNPLTVKGTIYEKNGINPIKDAIVEVWHLSPNSCKYRHRAKLRTDENGLYDFITDFPNKEKGKNARIYFKISTSEESSFTELILNNSGAHITGEHWVKNQQLGTKLFPKRMENLHQTSIHFNISI